jgi:glutathione S-transferase
MTTTQASPLRLYLMGPEWGLPSMSPFGLKLATWLRMTGVDHQVIVENDPRKGPKGKSPWIVDGDLTLGDTEFIIGHLRASRGVDPDARLSPREQAIALVLRRTYEEHFHQIGEYSYWELDQGWEHTRSHFDFLPAVVRPLLLKVIRNDCRKEGRIRGIGRHSEAEIARKAAEDLAATETLLGDQPYLFGAEPTTTDCTVYAFLALTLWSPIRYFAQDELKRRDKLVAYCERMRARFWSEEPVAMVA